MAALSKVKDVDIKGGWKVDEPYALSVNMSALLPHNLCRVPYAALTKTFSLIEATTKRLEKTALLTSFLLLVIQRSSKKDSKALLQAVYLCINRVRGHVSGIQVPTETIFPVEPRLYRDRTWDWRELAHQSHFRIYRSKSCNDQGRSEEGGRFGLGCNGEVDCHLRLDRHSPIAT